MNDQKIVEMEVSEIQLLGEVQSRVGLDEGAIEEFAEKIKDGVEFPPIVVLHGDDGCICADGFHRVHAARRAGVEKIAAEIREGGRRDAILHSVGANAQHGVRRTNADKRRAVEILLRDDEWLTWSDGKIARRVAVSQPFVSKLRKEFTHNGYESPAIRETARGGPMDTTKIGKSPKKKDTDQPSSDASDGGDHGRDELADKAPNAQDREQGNAPTSPIEREKLNLKDGDADGSDDISGGVASDGEDVDTANEQEHPEHRVTEPAPAVTLQAAEEAYVRIAEDKAAQIRKRVTEGSVGHIDAGGELTDLTNLIHKSLGDARNGVNMVIKGTRTAVTYMARQTMEDGVAEGGNAPPAEATGSGTEASI